MTLRKLLKIIFGLLIFFAVVVGLTSINHPIILKWLTGSARHIGKPIFCGYNIEVPARKNAVWEGKKLLKPDKYKA